jgi:plasmid segregation protein ParM
MKNTHPVVAIDAGRSAVKVAYASGDQRGDFVFPSVVIPARELSNDQTAAKALHETVTVGDQKYFVGQTALEQSAGATYAGLSDDWTNQPAYKALIKSAMDRIEQRGIEFRGAPVVVVGAPSNVYASERQKIEEATRSALGGTIEVKVLPLQAAGVYYAHVFKPDGSVNGANMFRNGSSGPLKDFAVVEPGHFSTDYILFVNGNVNESTFTSTGGVFEAYEELGKILKEQRINASAAQLTEALINKQIFVYGKPVNVASQVESALKAFIEGTRSKTERLFAAYAQALDGILVAGGGGTLVFDAIEATYPHATLLPNPARMAVVNGFLAVGLAHAARSRPSIAKAA